MTDTVEKIASAPVVEVAPEVQAKDSPKKDKVEKAQRKQNHQQHNVVIVRRSLRFKQLINLSKDLLKNTFQTIELHAVDTEAYVTVTLVANCLQKYGYCTLARLKTKTHQVRETEGASDEERIIL